jgi:fumarate reductase flavoprotein subunit
VAVANELARSSDPTGATLIIDGDSWAAAKDHPSSTSLKIPSPNPWILDNGGEIFCRDSAEGLAEALGVNAANLQRTVTDYNRAVQANNTKALNVPRSGTAKILRAPLHGLRVVPGITFTMGGIAINGRAEVLDERANSIAGLYAAGDAIGGLMGGPRGGYTGGLMQAIVTGMLAGENSAETRGE